MLVADRMTRNPKTCEPNVQLYEARDILIRGGFRRLPVMESGVLVGIITDRDIREVLLPPDVPELLIERYDLLRVRRVKDHMARNPITIDSGSPLEVAAELFHRNSFGGLPVMEKERLVGIICQRDVMGGLLEGMGVHPGTFRFAISFSEKRSFILSKVLDIAERQGALPLCVLTDPERERNQNKRCYSIRISRSDPNIILPYLKELGVEVSEVVMEGRMADS